MAGKRLQMRQFREILRLKLAAGLSHREIARACSVGLGTITEYLRRAEVAGLGWPLPGDLDDAALEAKLFAGPSGPETPRPLPDFAWVHQELRRTGVTLQLIWHEYIELHPHGYRYSRSDQPKSERRVHADPPSVARTNGDRMASIRQHGATDCLNPIHEEPAGGTEEAESARAEWGQE